MKNNETAHLAPVGARRDRTAFVQFVLIAAATLALDQATKALVLAKLAPQGMDASVTLIPGVLDLTYVRNGGAAFGLLDGKTILFVAIAAVVCVTVLVYQRRVGGRHLWLTLGLGLLLGGSLGNLVDRVFRRTVVDFVHFAHFAVFNVANSAICVGVVVVGLHIVFSGSGPTHAPKDEPPHA